MRQHETESNNNINYIVDKLLDMPHINTKHTKSELKQDTYIEVLKPLLEYEEKRRILGKKPACELVLIIEKEEIYNQLRLPTPKSEQTQVTVRIGHINKEKGKNTKLIIPSSFKNVAVVNIQQPKDILFQSADSYSTLLKLGNVILYSFKASWAPEDNTVYYEILEKYFIKLLTIYIKMEEKIQHPDTPYHKSLINSFKNRYKLGDLPGVIDLHKRSLNIPIEKELDIIETESLIQEYSEETNRTLRIKLLNQLRDTTTQIHKDLIHYKETKIQ